MSEDLQVGDFVKVLDEGLAMLRRLCPDMPPNHHGRVCRLSGNLVYVEFPIGGTDYTHCQVSVYERNHVVRREH